jgi:5-methylcytosine-specific restriction endonuclease McrA
MFIQNKYTRWYHNIVEQAQNRIIDGYVEKHHIIPRSLGGTDDRSNLVILTAKEHFICHLLLTRMTVGLDKRSMWHAAWNMINQRRVYQQRYKVSSRMYELIKRNNAQSLSAANIGKPSGRKGQPCTWGDKISKTLTGRKPTAERNAKVSTALTGRVRPPRTEEWTLAQQQTIANNRITCEHCNKNVTKSAHTRSHGSKCKMS